jgi:hypothetical protein
MAASTPVGRRYDDERSTAEMDSVGGEIQRPVAVRSRTYRLVFTQAYGQKTPASWMEKM